MLCGLVGRYDAHLEHVRNVIGAQARRAHDGGDERADAGAAHAVHHRHLRQRGAQRRGTGRHRADGRGRGAALRHAAQGGLPVAFDLRLVAARRRRGACARRATCSCSARPTSNATARCTATRRCRRACAAATCPRPRSAAAANLLVLPNLDAANILFNVLKMTGGHGVTVGPILLGAAKPAHILTAVGDRAARRQHDGAGGGRRGGSGEAALARA